MADEKDVGVETKKKVIEQKDNKKLQEVLCGYRTLYFDEKHFIFRKFKVSSIRVYDKSILSIGQYGDEMFTRTKNKLMKDPEMITHREQLAMLTERGLWGGEKEKELADLRKKANDILEEKGEIESLISEIETDDGKNEAKSRKLHKKLEDVGTEWIKIYGDYMDVVSLNNTFFADTIESQAETMQRKGWIVSSVCRHGTKENPLPDKYDPKYRLWTSVEDFSEELNQNDLIQIMTECMDFWESRGDGESFFVESPEDLTLGSDGDTKKSTVLNSTPVPNTDSSSPTNS